MDPLTTVNPRRGTAQREQADSRQVPNNAGGFTFQVSDEQRLLRFLTLGSEAPTYYSSARELTKDNAQFLIELAQRDHQLLRTTLRDVSLAGRAPRQNPTLFALAVACSYGTDTDRSAALASLSQVCRTGTHLFTFAKYVEQFRGWGRGLRRAVAGWYLDKDVDRLAYQLIKYRQREGWSHRDLLRLSHPKTDDPVRDAMFAWVTQHVAEDNIHEKIRAFILAQKADADIPRLITDHNLPWEALPDEALVDPDTWHTLIGTGLPLGAMLRQLPRLTRIGVLDSGASRETVVNTLTDSEALKKARIHPVNVLVAMRTYAQGQGRGSDWTPVPQITDALDEAFYAAFGAVEPAGKRTMLALDVSGSMSWEQCGNLPITPREASAALAMVQTATEPVAAAYGFTGGNSLTRLDFSKRRRLDDVIASVSHLPFGATDCALPMLVAKQESWEVDTFVVYTDNETWAGQVHPHEALRQYRQASGIPARLVVVGMTSTRFSIADPSDPGMLDVAGFDSSVPSLVTGFSRGDF